MDKQTDMHFKTMTKISNDYLEEVVKPLLPNAEKGGVFGEGVSVLQKITISPVLVNGFFLDSIYEYKKRPLRFIHYTDIDSGRNIIHSAKMRMSSLASMSDPQELSFALLDAIPAKTHGTINDYKCNIFSLSMNEFQEETENNENWIDYGDNGRGVGIVFTFPDENFEEWHQHYLSKIRYNEKDINKLKDFHNRHKMFAKRTDVEIHGQVRNFLLPLAAFHKTKDLKRENEIRLLIINQDAYLPDSQSQYNPIIVEYKNNQISKSYIEFQLNLKHKKQYGELRPIPKIEKIILGPKLTETAKLKIELNKLAKENLGYEVKVEKSKLKL